MPVILSLFDYTGNWLYPWTEHGHKTMRVDLKHGLDIFDPRIDRIDDVVGILAAPPCTDFAGSGARWWKEKDERGQTAQSLELVRRTLDLVEKLDPDWWALEQPVGRLPRLIPELGKPVMYFHPYEFAGWADDPQKDAYTKKTALFGQFNTNLVKSPVEPVRVCAQGSWIQRLGGKSERTKELRSATPQGFSRAFYFAQAGGS